ncbi:MAG: Holliday junction resolvase RuvX [Planctomycetota bacterium]
MTNPFPASGRIAAVDYGTVRIGVAVCDPDRILASPLEVYPVSTAETDAKYFQNLARNEKLVGFVVGLPIHCDGGESQKSQESRRFARWLADQTGLPIRLFDERFTTAAAKQKMAAGNYGRKGKKKRVDAIAAQVLLESFLEACRYHGAITGHPIDAAAEGDRPLDDPKPLDG